MNGWHLENALLNPSDPMDDRYLLRCSFRTSLSLALLSSGAAFLDAAFLDAAFLGRCFLRRCFVSPRLQGIQFAVFMNALVRV